MEQELDRLVSKYLNYIQTKGISLISNRAFHEVLDALLILYPNFVQLPTSTTLPAQRITDDYRFNNYFKDCIGAIDGSEVVSS
jgi:hypothetical protein